MPDFYLNNVYATNGEYVSYAWYVAPEFFTPGTAYIDLSWVGNVIAVGGIAAPATARLYTSPVFEEPQAATTPSGTLLGTFTTILPAVGAFKSTLTGIPVPLEPQYWVFTIEGGGDSTQTVTVEPSTLSLVELEDPGPSPVPPVFNVGRPGVITPVGAPSGAVRGPYIFDPTDGVGVSAVEATVASRLEAGRRYSELQLGAGEALNFPAEPGFLVFDFGASGQVGPVRYLGRLSNSVLSLDAAFKFPATIEVGTTVTLLHSRTAFVPENVEEVGAFYLTASPAGRVAAESLLRAISATGIDLDITIRYPGDRGLGGEGFPVNGPKVSDIVSIFGSDNLDAELAARRAE